MTEEEMRKYVWSCMGNDYTHIKTGVRYVITGVCMIESTWRVGVIYRRAHERYDIVRDAEEFFDGRFVRT